jgi:hypothetical protein
MTTLRIQFGRDDYVFIEADEHAKWKWENPRIGCVYIDGYDGDIHISVNLNAEQTEVIVIRGTELWRMRGEDRDETVSKMQALLQHLMGAELEPQDGTHFTDQWRIDTDYSDHTVRVHDHQLNSIRQLVRKLEIVQRVHNNDPTGFATRIVDLKLTQADLNLIMAAIPKSLNPGKV